MGHTRVRTRAKEACAKTVASTGEEAAACNRGEVWSGKVQASAVEGIVEHAASHSGAQSGGGRLYINAQMAHTTHVYQQGTGLGPATPIVMAA